MALVYKSLGKKIQFENFKIFYKLIWYWILFILYLHIQLLIQKNT